MSDVESVPVDSIEPETDDQTHPTPDAVSSASDATAERVKSEEEVTPETEAEPVQEAEVSPPEEGDEVVILEETAKEAEESELEALRTELEQVQTQAAEYLDGWQRARAEFANYKKRVEAEREGLRRTSTEALLLKLLPVVDDFERAIHTLPEESPDAPWADGIKMILRKLQTVLESEDVTPIEAAGKPFDPLWHEAVMQEETEEHPDGNVIEEMQRGYRLGNRVLRPSMVKVASNANDSGNESES